MHTDLYICGARDGREPPGAEEANLVRGMWQYSEVRAEVQRLTAFV